MIDTGIRHSARRLIFSEASSSLEDLYNGVMVDTDSVFQESNYHWQPGVFYSVYLTKESTLIPWYCFTIQFYPYYVEYLLFCVILLSPIKIMPSSRQGYIGFSKVTQKSIQAASLLV